MKREIQMAAVQMNAAPAPTGERLARAETLIGGAARDGAELVVLPELFNSGYEYSEANYRRAERMDGETVGWMRRMAAQYGIHLAGTLLLLDEQDIYNAMLLIAPDGRQWRYDKNYPWEWERAYFRAGEGITIAATDLGKIGMLICWDSAHTDLWARYAGRIDAMIIASCPPLMHELTLIMPNGQPVRTGEMGPALKHIGATSGEAFGGYLRNQARCLGIPVVNTTGTGRFSSALPLPALSLMLYSLIGQRADLLRYLAQAQDICAETGYFNETYIADAHGEVLAKVEPEAEGYVTAPVTLAEQTPPAPPAQPPFGLPPLAYLADQIANAALSVVYRRTVRQVYGPHMAPLTVQERLWIGALVGAMAGTMAWRLLRKK